jgi:hypothetical protein
MKNLEKGAGIGFSQGFAAQVPELPQANPLRAASSRQLGL